MKNLLFYTLISLLPFSWVGAQNEVSDLPEMNLDAKEIRTQLEFLASDFLRGRRTNSPGNEIAAEYIASHLKAYNYETAPGQDDYYQKVPLVISSPPKTSSLTINGQSLNVNDDYLILSGPSTTVDAKGVFAGYGWVDEDINHDDYADIDVKGKVVFVLAGPPGAKDPSSIFSAMGTKRELAEKHGAAALFELYQLPFPWGMFANYFGGESMRIADADQEEDSELVYGWLNKLDELPFETIQTTKKLEIQLASDGTSKEMVSSSNVIGVLPGSDPELRDEYIIITAHYDHVGVGEQGGEYTEQDSIFNGARDNGIGVVGLLAAAKSFAELRPKRSVIILAVTAEELGLLGSQYYASHPLIPLEKTIFNFNTDGAGYTDTTAVSIVGWGRTGTNDAVEKGATAFGLNVIKNPVPEMHLFDRSDNVSFAKKGVPCLSLSPGFSEFGNELMQNYHQVSDDTDGLNWAYITKYCQVFTYAVRLIADAETKPRWVEGDTYEAAGKELYEKD